MKDKLNKIKDYVIEWNKTNTEDFYKTERYIWENPELPMQEYKSSAALVSVLKKYGFTVETGVADMPTAFLASYGSSTPVIGVNAEYDALPGLSQDREKLFKYPIMEGAPGHGCGHNLLGTGGVKAAIAVKAAMERFDLPGTIKVLGTPAEELCLGKAFFGKAGLLKGYDAILDWHPWNHTKMNYDSCQAYFSVKFHFKGRTSHGNSPWHGRSALDAAMLQGHAVEMMREHMYPGYPPDAANTINYTFTTTGPEFPSVVPDYTTAWYVGRFTTTEEMMLALDRVTKCAKGAALSTETEFSREIMALTHHKIPNKRLAECFRENLMKVGIPEFTEEEQEKAKAIQRSIGCPETGLAMELLPFEGGYSGLCDTSEFSWNAPYASAWIAMGIQDCGWHHWGITSCAGNTMGRKSMDCAASSIALTAIDVLCDKALRKEIQEEWTGRMDGKAYQCLLPEDMVAPVQLNKDIMDKYR